MTKLAVNYYYHCVFFSEQSRYFRSVDFLCAKNCIKKIWESTRRVSEYFWFTSSRSSLLTASVNINFIYWLIHHVFPFFSSFLASKYKKQCFFFWKGVKVVVCTYVYPNFLLGVLSIDLLCSLHFTLWIFLLLDWVTLKWRLVSIEYSLLSMAYSVLMIIITSVIILLFVVVTVSMIMMRVEDDCALKWKNQISIEKSSSADKNVINPL